MNTFGYNVITSLAEIVADRLVKASFLDGTIRNTFSGQISPELLGGMNARFHALISDPAIEFGTGAPNRVYLTFQIHAVLDLPQNVMGIADADWVKASVSVSTQLIATGATLSPRLDTLTSGDIVLEKIQSNNSTLAPIAPSILPTEIAKSLRDDAEFKKLGFDLGFDLRQFSSNAVDPVVLDGPPPEDRDELILAFYDKKDPENTRGDPGGIKLSLAPGKSVTLHISKTVVDAIIAKEMNTRFMRFDVTLGEPVPEQPGGTTHPYSPSTDQMTRGIFWGKSTAHDLSAGLPAYYISVKADPRRDNLHNCTVTNLRTGELQNFQTNNAGEGVYPYILLESETLMEWSGTSTHDIRMHDIVQGDTLRFHGECKSSGESYIYYPDIQLGDGCIHIAVKAVSDVLCYDSVTAHLKGQVSLAIDPATGEIQVSSGEPEVDLPWYVDAGVGILKALIYAFTGPAGGTLISTQQPPLAGELGAAALQRGQSLIPTVAEGNRLRLFWEDISFNPDGIMLSGQIESGWILDGGRAQKLMVDFGMQRLEIGNGSADLWGPSYVGGIAIVTNKSFESLGPEELAKLTYQPGSTTITIPNDAALEGLILGVQTDSGHFAKARVDRSQQNKYVLRWITYEKRPEPAVSIVGTLNVTHGSKPEDTKAWGAFRIEADEEVYSDYGLKVKWQYSGPGKAIIDPNDGKVIHIEIDFATDVSSPVEFNPALEVFGIHKVLRADGSLRVSVQDIFGRMASAERAISCESPLDAGGLEELLPAYATQWELVKWLRGSDPAAAELRRIVAARDFGKLVSWTEAGQSQALERSQYREGHA